MAGVQVIEINMTEIKEPILCAPNDPDDARLLSEVQGDAIQEVCPATGQSARPLARPPAYPPTSDCGPFPAFNPPRHHSPPPSPTHPPASQRSLPARP